jgi:hypothetical protein
VDDWRKGDRVRIIDQMPSEYAGRTGTIAGIEEVTVAGRPEYGKISTPKIILDDGTVVYGFQLWWQKIGESE